MPPTKVMIIRHAERPAVAGWRRVGALPHSFAPLDPGAIRHGAAFDHSIEHLDVEARAALPPKASGVVLVSWEHGVIGDLVTKPMEGAVDPLHRPHDRFEMVFVLDRVASG